MIGVTNVGVPHKTPHTLDRFSDIGYSTRNRGSVQEQKRVRWNNLGENFQKTTPFDLCTLFVAEYSSYGKWFKGCGILCDP